MNQERAPLTPESHGVAPATELTVSGMTCQNCARHVSEALQGVAGVETVIVDLSGGRARVRWSAGVAPDAARALHAVRAAGYDGSVLEAAVSPATSRASSALADWGTNVVLGGGVMLTLMVGEWVFRLGMERWFQWAAFVLAAPVQIFCGARFYAGAWRQLRAGTANMDVLVALGSTAAFGYSLAMLLAGTHTHLYFMESVAIIALISVGHWLESLASARAESSLHALLDLAPRKACRRTAQGDESDVPVAALQLGDELILRPGDAVPTDGEVTEGTSSVDESMLTGEAKPIDKAAGTRLYGGTFNQTGRLVMRVTATGEATALAQIIAVVQRAQSSRAEIQKLGDRVSRVFVPIVVGIALVTGLWWGLAPDAAHAVSALLGSWLWPVTLPESPLAAAIISAVGVLIVACPCAMGLATPAAIMAGTNAAARRGILIRDGAALEKSGRITAVLFDKTGTLTQGKPGVVAVDDRRPRGEQAKPLAQIAAALAQPSRHPFSQALAGLHDEPLPVADWEELRGAGVQARLAAGGVAGPLWRLGALNWLGEAGVDLSAAAAFVQSWSAQGATILGLAVDQRLAGLFALRDVLKPDVAEVVATLRRQGQQVFLVTGDQVHTAWAVATQSGIPWENVFADVRPEQKAEIVQRLQQRGERVAFVGDGINDAPALEQADLGIAVSRASDVAREAADILLLHADLHAIPEALGLAQATLRTIKQNLFWAFFYNAAAVPLAALGFLSPVLCAAAMGLSDLVVIGNALRLRNWKLK